MPASDPNSLEANSSLRREAAEWIVARERGFTESQAAGFRHWLAADPRHAAAIDEASGVWMALNRIPAHIGQPIVNKSGRSSRWRRPVLGGLAVAASAALMTWLGLPASGWMPGGETPSALGQIPATASQARSLADGTRVRLNVGSEIAEDFSDRERRVRLVRGEAYFIVTHDAVRPFIVEAGDITVRAVGTAFNVRWQPQAVEVLVTEGKVEVTPPQTITTTAAPLIVAGQRAVVNTTAGYNRSEVVVSPASQADLAAALAWHEPLRKLAGVTLMELAGDFERQTGRRLIVADEALRELQIGGRFRSDDLEELLRLLAENYGITSERAADGSVVLRKAR